MLCSHNSRCGLSELQVDTERRPLKDCCNKTYAAPTAEIRPSRRACAPPDSIPEPQETLPCCVFRERPPGARQAAVNPARLAAPRYGQQCFPAPIRERYVARQEIRADIHRLNTHRNENLRVTLQSPGPIAGPRLAKLRSPASETNPNSALQSSARPKAKPAPTPS